MTGFPARLKKHHAVAPSGDQERLKTLAAQQSSPQGMKPRKIVADSLPESRLDFRLIGCCRGDVLIRPQVIAGVNRNRQWSTSSSVADEFHLARVRRAVAIVGHQKGRRGAEQGNDTAG